ncbi:MAG: elongation factor G [Chloroflexi bacterium]|nr:elongation factor G [Chloroflexota bacterium]
MKDYSTSDIRNVALVSHGGNGKTTLAEAMLFESGATTRFGRVEEGNTVSDYDPDEIKRHSSVSLSIVPVEWKGAKINLLDTPGYVDFVGEEKAGLYAADCALLLVDATAGVQVGTESAWAYMNERELPRMILVNRMDRENANFDNVVDALRERFGSRCAAAQIPIGSQDSFQGVIDLVKMKAYLGEKSDEADIPADLADAATSYRERLVEAVAETDDDLTLKYLEGEEISNDELAGALRAGACRGAVVPILAASASKNIGICIAMDEIVSLMPSPADAPPVKATPAGGGDPVELTADTSGPLAALVFKTSADPYVGKLTYFRVFSGEFKSDSHVQNVTKHKDERIGQVFYLRGKQQENTTHVIAGDIGTVAKLADTSAGDSLCNADRQFVLSPVSFPKPAYRVAVGPKTKNDQDKLGPALQRIAEEDPTLHLERDPDTGEIILAGIGEAHLHVAAERMQRKFGVGIELRRPKVPYRETITTKNQAEYKHKKQTGGAGQYGHVFLELEPLPRGSGFEFAEKVVGGSVPREFFPAVEKGVREALKEGTIAHYPITDVRVTLYDGSSHPVDSKAIAFELAGSQALKKGMQQGHAVLLEPVMKITVRVPDANTGDVMSDMNTKRGHVHGMTPVDGLTVIEAEAPLAELMDYATDLRALTQGRGSFEMEFGHYQEVPQHLAQKVTEAANKERELAGAHA